MVEHELHNLVGACHLLERAPGELCLGSLGLGQALGRSEQGVHLPLSCAHQPPHESLWRDMAIANLFRARGMCAPCFFFIKDLVLSTRQDAADMGVSGNGKNNEKHPLPVV